MVKIWKLQEGQEVIPLPRSLITSGPLPFCGDRGRSPRIGAWKGLMETADQELPCRKEYLLAENRIFKVQLQGRLRLSDAERMTLGEIGPRLGRKALSEVATAVLPDTILKWYRRLVARKFDGSSARPAPGRPPIGKEIEASFGWPRKIDPGAMTGLLGR
jgi:hypothetical protein